MKEAIKEILEKTAKQYPSRVWIGKNYSIADLQRDLEKLLVNMED